MCATVPLIGGITAFAAENMAMSPLQGYIHSNSHAELPLTVSPRIPLEALWPSQRLTLYIKYTLSTDSITPAAVAMTEGPPSISISFSLAPNPHSYSNPTPPTLSLTAISHASRPLTILTWHTLLYPHLALRQSAFRITDLTTGTRVAQTTVQLSRAPLQRRVGSPDEQLFLTLFPEQPVTVNTPFGYPVEPNGPPRPEGHPGRMRESARGAIPRSVCGVDGLVVGGEYELSVCGGLEVWWWRWGTRKEVLEPEGSREAELGDSEEGFEIDGEGIDSVIFHVVQ
ncbi:MAG: hypothetical protein M1830_001982 [Pleopsidium flavum]|nr:MAG: hypothetical protein M1830_001982 [Pleopsidium flavum]